MPRLFQPRPVRAVSLALVAAAFGIAGCQPGTVAVDSRVIRVANTGHADFDDLASLAAHDILQAAGYRVETTQYRLSTLSAEAVARGDADIGIGATPTYLRALAKGAPVRLVGEHVSNPHRLVTPAGASCRDLAAGHITSQNEGAATTVLARAWLSESCPGQPVTFLFVQQSDNRLAALLSGRVEAAILKATEVVRLNRLAPGRFSVMADFSRVWPDLVVVGIFANADWSARHGDLLDLYMQARQEAARRLQTTEAVARQASELLGPSEDWPEVAERYVAADAWGTLTPDRERLESTLAFFEAHAGIVLNSDAIADMWSRTKDR